MKRRLLLITLLTFFLAEVQAQQLYWDWARKIGKSYSGFAPMLDIASDDQGNFYLAGSFADSIMLGDTMLTTAGDVNIYLAKFDPQGNLVWIINEGGLSDQITSVMKLSGDGTIYINAGFDQQMTVDGTTYIAEGDDILLMAYDLNGMRKWCKHIRGKHIESLFQLGADNSGNVYVPGTMRSDLSVDSITLYRADGVYFVLKFDSNGNIVWARNDGVPQTNSYRSGGIAVTAAGFSYQGVYFSKSIEVEGQFHQGAPSGALGMILKRDPDGHLLWARVVHGFQWFINAHVIEGETLVLTGANNGTLYYGSTTTSPYGNYAMAGFDSSATPLWAMMCFGDSYFEPVPTDAGGIFLPLDGKMSFAEIGTDGMAMSIAEGNGSPNGVVVASKGDSYYYLAELKDSIEIVVDTVRKQAAGEIVVVKLKKAGLGLTTTEAPAFDIYPNPAKDQCTIRLPESARELLVLDVSGKLLEYYQLSADSVSLNLSKLSAGTYFVVINGGGETRSQKLIISR